jgi:hypothetical protein
MTAEQFLAKTILPPNPQIKTGSCNGVFVRVSDNGGHCFVAPCASTDEGKLNSQTVKAMHGIDVSSNVSSSIRTKASNAINGTDAGDRSIGDLNHAATTLRSTNQILLRIK